MAAEAGRIHPEYTFIETDEQGRIWLVQNYFEDESVLMDMESSAKGDVIDNTIWVEDFDEFEDFGEVTSVKIITDKYTGQSRGIGFIEMTNKKEALAAISDLNDKELKGRALKVNEAQPKKTYDDNNGGGNRGVRVRGGVH